MIPKDDRYDELSRTLLAVPASVGLARDLIHRALTRWRYGDRADDVTLVASELITNAVNATPGRDIHFHLTVVDDCPILEVWDASERPPASRTAAADDTTGRGLGIVEFLTADWGYRYPDEGGKVVYALFDPK